MQSAFWLLVIIGDNGPAQMFNLPSGPRVFYLDHVVIDSFSPQKRSNIQGMPLITSIMVACSIRELRDIHFSGLGIDNHQGKFGFTIAVDEQVKLAVRHTHFGYIELIFSVLCHPQRLAKRIASVVVPCRSIHKTLESAAQSTFDIAENIIRHRMPSQHTKTQAAAKVRDVRICLF